MKLTATRVAAVIVFILGTLFAFRGLIAFIPSYVGDQLCSPVQDVEYLATVTGRIDSNYPSPRCCSGIECIETSSGRHAVLTTLRSDNYLPLLQALRCSLKKSNPNLTVIVAIVEGDLSPSTVEAIEQLDVSVVYWKDIRYANTRSPRFELNWVKIRAWEMVEYDALLMVDADAVVVGDVSHLFSLPTAFAAALDQDKTLLRHSSLGTMQGGVVLLRPCAAVAHHMISLLDANSILQYPQGHAEQSFFDWYFRYERWSLPIEYNALSHLLQNDSKTRAGTKPIIVHYTRDKPFTIDVQSHKEHAYAIC